MLKSARTTYRGRDVRTGEWVYGNLVDRVTGCKPFIVTHAEMQDDGSLDIEFRFVDPDSVEVWISKDKASRREKEGEANDQFRIAYTWGSTNSTTYDSAKDLKEAYAKVRKKYEKNPNLGWAMVSDIESGWCLHIDPARLCNEKDYCNRDVIFDPLGNNKERKFGITMYWRGPEDVTFTTAPSYRAAVGKLREMYKEKPNMKRALVYDGITIKKELMPPAFENTGFTVEGE